MWNILFGIVIWLLISWIASIALGAFIRKGSSIEERHV